MFHCSATVSCRSVSEYKIVQSGPDLHKSDEIMRMDSKDRFIQPRGNSGSVSREDFMALYLPTGGGGCHVGVRIGQALWNSAYCSFHQRMAWVDDTQIKIDSSAT